MLLPIEYNIYIDGCRRSLAVVTPNNINAIKTVKSQSCNIKIIPSQELNERAYSNPTPGL